MGEWCAACPIGEFLSVLLFVLSFVSLRPSASNDHLLPSTTSSLPSRNSSTDWIYLGRGMVGKIRCPLKANPPHVVIVWLKNNRTMDLSVTRPRIRMDKRGGLVFRSVVTTDEGLYCCVSYSPMSPSHRSPMMYVIIRDPPYFVIRPSAIYQTTPGQTIIMPCAAKGDPTPTIVWNKVSGDFPSVQRRDQEEGNMTLARLVFDDSGTYECIAVNVVATVATTALLIVESLNFHGPYNLTGHASTNCVRLSWLPSYHNGHHVHYILWYRVRAEERESWQTLQVVPEDTMWVVLYGLRSSTPYEVMVMSRDQQGEELFSAVITVMTKRASADVGRHHTTTSGTTKIGLPSESGLSPFPSTRITGARRPYPPSNIAVSPTPNGLLITWSSTGTSPVPARYYVVEYCTVGPWVPLTRKTTSTSFLWTTMSRGATYHFRVISYSADKMTPSDPSTPLTFRTEDPISQGTVRFGNGAVGGLIAGILFLITSAALTVFVVRILRKRRRQKDNRYQNVKYFGPNHHTDIVGKNESQVENELIDTSQVLSNCVSTHIAQDEFCHKNRGVSQEQPIVTEIVESEATV